MRILLRIAAYGWRHKLLFVAAGVAVSVSIVPRTIIPRLLGTAIDEAMTSGLQGQLLLAAGLIALAALARGVLGYAAMYLTEATSQRVAYDLRKDFFRKLQSLSFGFYDRQQTGDLMSRATVDVDAVRMFIGFGLLQSTGLATAFGLTAFLMLTTNWRLGLISLAFLPVVIWPSIVMALRLNPVFSKMHDELGSMNAVVQENLTAMRVVKAFGARDYEKAKFERRAGAVSDHFNTAGKVFVSRSSIMGFVFLGTTAAILMFGGREVMLGRLTPGELAAFILYMGLLAMPVQMIGWRAQMFSRAFSAGRRIFEVLDAESPVRERPGARTLPRVCGHVSFEGVTFSYDSQGPVVRDVDFEVQPGQTVAILGGPGSGKSSVVHLIPRFYEVSSGRIAIDGIDVRDATLASLRANVGIVLQDVFAFSTTIRGNIAYGVDDAAMEDVVRAAKVAELHDFIEDLPDGYDTQVGERGITLSGGQRQRLAIARTILSDPPILILDDSTSSVDVGTEPRIQEAMARVIRGRTTLVIAHRLSTVRNADLILVFERGEVVERGTHAELMARGGFYSRIHDLQLRPREELGRPRPEVSRRGDV